MKCSVAMCSNDVRYKKAGLCSMHYQRARLGLPMEAPPQRCAPTKKCSAGDCDRNALLEGLCDGHFQQKRRGAPLTPLRVYGVAGCKVAGCTAAHDHAGYCAAHAAKWRRYGDPEGGRKPPVWTTTDAAAWTLIDARRVVVSAQDKSSVEGLFWCLTSDGYAVAKANGRSVRMHRLLMKPSVEEEVDHINGDRLDNRRENLRIVNRWQQTQNRGSIGASGHRNVYYEAPKGLYRVLVTKDGEKHSGGRFKSFDDAVAAAKALRAKLFTHHNEERH